MQINRANNSFSFCYILYDRVFKEIFLKESNQVLLKELLKTILKVDIKDIKYNNIERKYLDVSLTTNQGK